MTGEQLLFAGELTVALTAIAAARRARREARIAAIYFKLAESETAKAQAKNAEAWAAIDQLTASASQELRAEIALASARLQAREEEWAAAEDRSSATTKEAT